MKEFIGSCYVGADAAKSKFWLVPFAKDSLRGTSFMYGPIVEILRSEMVQNAQTIVFGCLRNQPVLESTPLTETGRIAQEKVLKLKRTCTFVKVVLLAQIDDGEELKVMPLHAKRGLIFDAEPEEIQVYPLPISSEQFLAVLDSALEIAS